MTPDYYPTHLRIADSLPRDQMGKIRKYQLRDQLVLGLTQHAAQLRERVEQFEAEAEAARAEGDQQRAQHADAQAAHWREWLFAAEQAARH